METIINYNSFAINYEGLDLYLKYLLNNTQWQLVQKNLETHLADKVAIYSY